MAKNMGEGKGQTKNVSPEQHEAARRAAKAKRTAAARARAHGSKASGPRTTGSLFDDIKNDRRQNLLDSLREERKQRADRAHEYLLDTIEQMRRTHVADSHTMVWAEEAYEAAKMMVDLYEATDPTFVGDFNNRIKVKTIDIVLAETRQRLAGIHSKRYAYTVIELARTALFNPRPVRKLAVA